LYDVDLDSDGGHAKFVTEDPLPLRVNLKECLHLNDVLAAMRGDVPDSHEAETRAKAMAWVEYNRDVKIAWDDLLRSNPATNADPAWAVYEQAKDAALIKYKSTCLPQLIPAVTKPEAEIKKVVVIECRNDCDCDGVEDVGFLTREEAEAWVCKIKNEGRSAEFKIRELDVQRG
jgi:hypothetical protein